LLVTLIFFTSSCFATDIDDFFVSVVYLKQERVKTIEYKGEDCELWLKHPGMDKVEAVTETVFGSGVLINFNNHPYLVTANHLSKQMTLTALAVFKGRNDEPIVIPFSDLTLKKTGLNWINHKHADVSVLPITTTNQTIAEKTTAAIIFSRSFGILKEVPMPIRTSICIIGDRKQKIVNHTVHLQETFRIRVPLYNFFLFHSLYFSLKYSL